MIILRGDAASGDPVSTTVTTPTSSSADFEVTEKPTDWLGLAGSLATGLLCPWCSLASAASAAVDDKVQQLGDQLQTRITTGVQDGAAAAAPDAAAQLATALKPFVYGFLGLGAVIAVTAGVVAYVTLRRGGKTVRAR